MPSLPPEGIDAGSAPERADAVYTVVLDGEAVLLDEGEDRLHLLNHTATLLWQLYDGAATLAELADDISEELGIARDEVLADLIGMSRHLAREGLLAGYAREGSEADA